jgi:site-specific DNA recombinase
MRRAKKEGRWMVTAPKGYKNVRIDNRPTIIPNDDAKHVKWVFEEINKGVLAPDQIRKAVNKKGSNVSRSYFWTMIRNPLYCGRIFIPAYKNEEAYYVKSVHETLISEELFYNVQDILNGKKRPNVSTKQKDELPLRGFLTCFRCGGRLTGSASKGKLKRYFYYHCQPGCKERFRAGDINKETIKKLKEISAKKQALKLYRIILEKELQRTTKDTSDDMQKVKAEIAKNQERIDYAEKTMLDRQMDMSEYRVIRSKYEAAIKNLKDEMKEAAPLSPDFRKFLDFGFNILETADRNMLQAAQNLKDKYIVRCCPKN